MFTGFTTFYNANCDLLIHVIPLPPFRPYMPTLYIETNLPSERQNVKISNGRDSCLALQKSFGGLSDSC